MSIELFFSVTVTIFSLALVLVGIPAQIIKNYTEKRSGQPLLTILIALGFYVSSIGLFILTETYLPLISFGLGTVMWGITLVQCFLYRKNK
jgi:hypothetical protein